MILSEDYTVFYIIAIKVIYFTINNMEGRISFFKNVVFENVIVYIKYN